MTTDNDLLELLKTNPPVGFQELLSRHGSKLYRAASKLMRDKAEIEDVLQDSLIAVLKNIYTFNGKGELLAWLYRSAAPRPTFPWNFLPAGRCLSISVEQRRTT